jgi:hypothetical protein
MVCVVDNLEYFLLSKIPCFNNKNHEMISDVGMNRLFGKSLRKAGVIRSKRPYPAWAECGGFAGQQGKKTGDW